MRCGPRLRAERIGFVGASANLFDHLDVTDNVEFVRCLTPRGPRRPVEEVLAAVGLQARAHAYPGELSRGEAARAGLDLLVAAAHDAVAVVAAGHSSALAAVADRVVVLRDGQVQP
jgi:putative ABC transport system ATP-binding protein